MKKQKHYKPGTSKVLSPRVGNYSVRWGRLVLQTCALSPTKEINKMVVDLWGIGYSHKDAAAALRDFFEGPPK